jgi:hypothetical protein
MLCAQWNGKVILVSQHFPRVTREVPTTLDYCILSKDSNLGPLKRKVWQCLWESVSSTCLRRPASGPYSQPVQFLCIQSLDSSSLEALRIGTNLRKGTIYFVMLVCPVCPHELGSHRKDFHEILYLIIFRKSIEKIQVSSKSDKSNGYLTWRPKYIYNIAQNCSQSAKCFRQKAVENIKTLSYIQ